MYLESIGNPRKFTRLARRTAAVKPLVVVQGARHGGAAPQGHAVRATRLPHATVSALLRQAGVIRVDTITELVDAGLLLARQPLPAGPRVAILGNSESLGLLTYDACLSEGLRPLPPAGPDDRGLGARTSTRRCRGRWPTTRATRWWSPRYPALGEASPGDAALARGAAVGCRRGSVQAGACGARRAGRAGGGAVGRGEHRTAGRRRGARPRGRCHPPPPPAPLERGDPHRPAERLPTEGRRAERPQAPGTRCRSPRSPPSAAPSDPAGSRLIPAYPAAERAVRALAEAVNYAQWRREAAEPGRVPEYEDIDEKGAAELIDALLARGRGAHARREETRRAARRGTASAVHRALPAPTPDEAARAAARPSATPSPSRPPPRTCGTAPTWAAYGSTWRTRSNCGGRTRS